MISTTFTPERIGDLQFRQHRHDEAFHKDIVTMSPIKIVTHMTLHMAKYVGRLASIRDDDKVGLHKILTDIFNISLAIANVMKNKLEVRSLDLLAGDIPFFMALTACIRDQAKACEAWDYLKDYPFAATIINSNSRIFNLVIEYSQSIGFDVVEYYSERIDEVERKSIFYERLKTS